MLPMSSGSCSKLHFLTFFSLLFVFSIPVGCANEGASTEDQLKLATPESSTTGSRREPIVAVTAVLKDAHLAQLNGRRFAVQASGDGPETRTLSDARGTLSLRLTPGARYTIRPLPEKQQAGVSAHEQDAYLEIQVSKTGDVQIVDSRRLFAANLQAHLSDPAAVDANAAKFQSARFGDSVFAP